MFKLEEPTLSDPYVIKKLQFLLQVPGLKLGCLEETLTLQQVTDRLRNARFLDTNKRLGKHIVVYETEDLGPGYVNSFSRKTLQHLLAVKLLSPDLPVYIRFMYGNLHFLLNERDLDEKLFKTNVVTLAYFERINEVGDLHVGPHVSYNRLYHLERYDGVVTTLEKALRNELVSCYNVHSFTSDLSDMPQ